jgi:hypothetical protein
MAATDGVYSLESIEPPKPKDTETWETKKPLGGWEKKTVGSVFIARPGIYFPMNPTKEQIDEIRGRGIGRTTVLENWPKIVDAWQKGDIHTTVALANVSRFCGAKSSISRSGGRLYLRNGQIVDEGIYTRATGDGEALAYGQWITRPVEMSFHPMPKRDENLQVRKMPMSQTSLPYSKALSDEEAETIIEARDIALEQPDAELIDYET